VYQASVPFSKFMISSRLHVVDDGLLTGRYSNPKRTGLGSILEHEGNLAPSEIAAASQGSPISLNLSLDSAVRERGMVTDLCRQSSNSLATALVVGTRFASPRRQPDTTIRIVCTRTWAPKERMTYRSALLQTYRSATAQATYYL